MPTIEQIRAARALLDWSQSDLADYAGLSQTGIARIENGTNQPNTSTLNKIRAAFEGADIEFLGTSGVRKTTGDFKLFKGTDGFRKFMDDVYERSKLIGGDICLFNGMPSQFIKWLGEDWYAFHAKRMAEIKELKAKIVVMDGETQFIANSFAEYRWFPKDMFHEKTVYTYGDSIAFLSFSNDDVQIRVIKQQDLADTFRILFNIAWENIAKKPSNKSVANG
jgi:transcriptional regulator with XRE-family HTH domain